METVPDAATAVPFSGAAACREGLLTKGRLRGPGFVPVHPDTYVGSTTEITPAVLRAALRVWLGPEVVIGGSLAADAHRAPTVDELVEGFVAASRRPRRTDVVVRRDRLPPFEIQEVDGVRVTTPERTAFDLARRLDLVDGVATPAAVPDRQGDAQSSVRGHREAGPRVAGVSRDGAVRRARAPRTMATHEGHRSGRRPPGARPARHRR